MTLTVAVFIAYFVGLALLGSWAASRSTDESSYWIAGGKLGWLTGGATLAATHASAGTFIGTVGVIYATGWSFTWLVLSIPLAYWFLAAVLAPRFVKQRELTLPAFLERRYGSRLVRAIGAIIILVAMIIYIQAQIAAGGLIAETVLGIGPRTGMIGFTLFLMGYTMAGGMIAVVATDVVQLIVMLGGALVAVPFVIQRFGGLNSLLGAALENKPQLLHGDSMPISLLLSMGIAFTLGSISTPEKLVRLYAMKDLPTIRRGVLLAISATTLMNLLVFVLALAAIAAFPELRSGDQAMPMVARELLPPLLGAVLLAAIVSAMMSTVDSLLLVAGSALARDLAPLIMRRHLSEHQVNIVNRVGVLVVGSTPLILLLAGFGRGELVQFVVLLFSALMAASFFLPVVGGLFWRRGNSTGALAAMVAGCVVTFAWKAWGSASVDPVFPGLIASTLAYILGSVVTRPPTAEQLSPYFDERVSRHEGLRRGMEPTRTEPKRP